ncbi:hypothetical protein [Chryseobacterium sp. Leaf394]|uniref:COG1470 family protein n=1 Tax=Chryseobacterium sp. Leaf394 TaxID=1736361 RepID=UPI0006FEB5EF|nr:hypothetical protein [Chryseobacterium sp. Leaf394]KQS94369.1 hypothetical protein ASG21_19285 [Chryseobacterium sp. Leaf394]
MIKNCFLYILILFPVIFLSQNIEKVDIYEDQILQPGTTTSVSFKIENPSAQPKTFELRVETSNESIKPILSKNEITVLPWQSYIHIVPVRISSDTPKGSCLIYLHIKDISTGEQITKKTALEISGKRNLTLTKGDFPEYVKAGETIKATVIAKNNGNMTEKLFLSTEKSSFIEGDSVIILHPGESRTIGLTQYTNPDVGTVAYQNIYLNATTENTPVEKTTAYNNVKIIPVKPTDEDIYHRLPVVASVNYIGQSNRGDYRDGFQGELSGIGSLSKDNSDVIQFHAITKNPVEFNAFTPYEEYFVNYKNKNFSAHLGDKGYSSSLLTEFARYGRGAELNYRFKKISVGGFYNHPRFFRDIKDEYNVYSTYHINNESDVKAGYLYKIPRTQREGLNTHLPYITGKTKILKLIDAQGELAYSKNNFTDGFAYMAQLQGNFNKITAGLIYLKASSDFSGYFTNTNSMTANLQYRVLERLTIVGNYKQDATNFKRDTLFGVAPYQKYLQAGLEFKYAQKGKLMLLGGFQRYQDRLEIRRFDYNESFIRASINQQIGIFNIGTEAQLGTTENYLNGISGQSRLYSVNLGFEKFKTSFSLYGSYAENSRYLNQNQKQIYYGARIISRFSSTDFLSIFYQNNYIPEDFFTDRNLFEAVYHQQIFRNHFIDLSGRYTLQRGQTGNRDFIVSLKYSVNINAPVKKIAEYVTLSGNISNLGIEKVEGIRLFMGNYISISDKDGNYIFKNVAPKDYTIEIDRSTLGLNNITDIRMPAEVNLTDKENILNFGITNAALIQGDVILHQEEKENSVRFAQLSTAREKKKQESVIVEASQGDQIFRKIVSVNDKFDFTYLRPGDWTVKIYRDGMDKRYKIATDKFEFTLRSGEKKNIAVNITRQQKEIRYQQEPVKVSYNGSKTGK